MAIGFGDLVELYRAGSLPEAHAVCIALEGEGISAHVDNDILQGALGDLPVGWSTAPRVLVNRSNVAAARAILDKAHELTADRVGHEGSDEDSSRCLACGAEMGQTEKCPACGWSYDSAMDTSGTGPGESHSPEGGFRLREGDSPAPRSEGLQLPTSRAKMDEAVRVTTEKASSSRDEDEPAKKESPNLIVIAAIVVPSLVLLLLAWFVLR